MSGNFFTKLSRASLIVVWMWAWFAPTMASASDSTCEEVDGVIECSINVSVYGQGPELAFSITEDQTQVTIVTYTSLTCDTFEQSAENGFADPYLYLYLVEPHPELENTFSNTLLVQDDDGASHNEGKVEIYKYNYDNDWERIDSKIRSSEDNTHFGSSVAISNNGNIIAIGERGSNKVEIYKKDISWNYVRDISNSSTSDFGSNIKLSGNGLTLAVGSPGYNNHTGKINLIKFDINFNILIDREFVGDASNNKCGKNITLTNDGKMINYGLDSRNEIIIQNLENDTSYNFEGIGTNYGISTLSKMIESFSSIPL